MRLNLEQILSVLRRRGLLDEVLAEAGAQSLEGPGILEEYQKRVEEQKREIAEKQAQVRSLQSDYE